LNSSIKKKVSKLDRDHNMSATPLTLEGSHSESALDAKLAIGIAASHAPGAPQANGRKPRLGPLYGDSAPAAQRGERGALRFEIGTPLEQIEREVIVATLAHCGGRKRATAEMLGVSLKTLYNRLNEYGNADCASCDAPA
jgi:DNA-binding NtrC family response regulator